MLGAYFVLLPNARVLTAIFFILIFFQELPAVFFLGFWFVFQLWQGGFSIVQPEAGGGVRLLRTHRRLPLRGADRPARGDAPARSNRQLLVMDFEEHVQRGP